METVRLKSATQLLVNISLQHKRFGSRFSKFIFRGQGDATWPLIPSALRKGTKFPTENGIVIGPCRTVREQKCTELAALKLFLQEANLRGESIPNETLIGGDSISDLDLDNRVGRNEIPWPPDELLSATAIAQHYGIPTRLLDWTRNPFFAAYFAAKDSLKLNQKGSGPASLAIYATDVGSGYHNQEHFYSKDRARWYRERRYYRKFEAVAHCNPRMKAQKGLFLGYMEMGNIANRPVQILSVEDYVSMSDESVFAPKLIRFTAPACTAGDALRLLRKHFVSASTISPGLQGCVESVRELAENLIIERH